MVWFTKTTTDLLLVCDSPGCRSVVAQDESGIFATSEHARGLGWAVGGLAYCPDHADQWPMVVVLGNKKQAKRRAEILETTPLSKEYTG
tara:strand:+ start:367 stop:633 length:267 start_codon:yes stop_codon:yes gene_type:complete